MASLKQIWRRLKHFLSTGTKTQETRLMENNGWKFDPDTMTTGANYGLYVHWFKDKEADLRPDKLSILRYVNLNPRSRTWTDGFLSAAKAVPPGGKAGGNLADSVFASGQAVPLPSEFANPKQHDDWRPEQILHRLPEPEEIRDDTIITGILDTGIALNQMMTNIAPQKTRVIASWQQGARHTGNDSGALQEDWLPCGREVYSKEINDALCKHGDTTGVVDEVAFNRDLALSTPDHPLGNRDLEMAFAHGTHTLNLAAGMDHWSSREEDRARHRIVAVNLPSQYLHGSGGNFLAYFAVYGVERILFLADALWAKKGLDPDATGMVGFPIVINFSYGMVAGPKDGHGLFEKAFFDIIEDRKKRYLEHYGVPASPVRILMPAGNDNLERGAASSLLGAKDAQHPQDWEKHPSINLPWQIKPEDSTANFIEIWSEPKPKAVFEKIFVKRSNGDLKVFVSPPGDDRFELGPLVDETYQDLDNYARVYCQFIETKEEPSADEWLRLRLLVCVAATASEGISAPAGTWTVRIEYTGDPAVDFEFYIQSDQSAVVTSKTGLRSYFDHPAYRTHMIENPLQFGLKGSIRHSVQDGRLADTFAMPTGGTGRSSDGTEVNLAGRQLDNDYWLNFGPVQRRGMANALVSRQMEEIIAVGSYDDSTGTAAIYSSSTSGNVGRSNKPGNVGRREISVCLPGENAPSLFGVLSAGARDGSVVASRGTSMATGLATRTAAMAFQTAQSMDLTNVATETWFKERAEVYENSAKKDHLGQYAEWQQFGTWSYLKMGKGRLPDPRRSQKINRLG